MITKGRTLALTGAWLQLGPLFGLFGSVIGMISAFQTMGEGGMGKPEALAEDIHFALITTAIGLVVGLVGLILMLIALFKFKYKEKWFFWFLIVISILMLPRVPAGTIIGMGLLIYLITHRNEFKTETDPARGA
jgi:flagellar motor component MotA